MLGVGADRSDGEHSFLPADGDDSTYTVPNDKKPNVSADVCATMPPAENEYSYAAPDVKRPIHLSPMHVTSGGDEYAVTDKQVKTLPSGCEEAVISTSQTNQPKGEEESAYLVPDQVISGQSTVPPETEYAYARPDVKRPTEISSDCLMIGPAVTARQGEDGGIQDRVGDQEDDSYAVPDQVKSNNDRIVVGKDEYAESAKRITLPRAGQADKPIAKRVPSNPLRHYTEGEDQYAVTAKKPSSPSKKGVQSSTIAPERFTVNESEYAVSSKQSKNPKRDHDRGSDVQPEHYLGGEDQYAVSGKSRSLPRSTKKAEDSDVATSAADDDDVQYAEVKNN